MLSNQLAEYDRMRWRRGVNAIGSEYNTDKSIDLNLSESELITLSIALDNALEAFGIKMIHEEIIEPKSKTWDETSHIGKLITLRRRVDAARHGRHTWNRNREGAQK